MLRQELLDAVAYQSSLPGILGGQSTILIFYRLYLIIHIGFRFLQDCLNPSELQ
jgi:hypothetical protein